MTFSSASVTRSAVCNFVCNMESLGCPDPLAIADALSHKHRYSDTDFRDALAQAYADAVQARSYQAVDAMREGAMGL